MNMKECEVKEDSGISIFDNGSGIAIHLNYGDKWLYKQDEQHQDRIKVLKGNDICVSVKVEQFYELFNVV